MQNVTLASEQAAGSSSYLELTSSEMSRMLGIPISTMCAWERRYGWRTPDRTHRGHRWYASLQVSQLPSSRARRSVLGMLLPPDLFAATEVIEHEAAA